ncbi:hypothetical protein NG791_27340, partial [Laspinema sp. D1]|uniref:hypothetical protein n=1 Tax=Laspinema palackyanum TaxID=3231601 RepID=UPI003476015D|nr:hypothetical protein [Laspinema sp. D2b]
NAYPAWAVSINIPRRPLTIKLAKVLVVTSELITCSDKPYFQSNAIALSRQEKSPSLQAVFITPTEAQEV